MTSNTSAPATGDDFDADVAELLAKVKKGPSCSVAIMLDTHPDVERSVKIRAWIADDGIPATKLFEFIAKHGGPRPATYSGICRHRKSRCECPA